MGDRTRLVVQFAALDCGCRFEKREHISTQVLWTACDRHAEIAAMDSPTSRWFTNRKEWPPTVEVLDEAVLRLQTGCTCPPDGGHQTQCPLYGGRMAGDMNPIRERFEIQNVPLITRRLP